MRVGGRRVRVLLEVQSPDVNEDRARPGVLAFGALASTAFAVDRFYGQGWGWVVAAVGLSVAAVAALVRDVVDPPDAVAHYDDGDDDGDSPASRRSD